MKTLNDYAEHIKGSMTIEEVYFNSTPTEFINFTKLLHKDIETKTKRIEELTFKLVKYEDKFGEIGKVIHKVPYQIHEDYGEMLNFTTAHNVEKLSRYMNENNINEMEYKEE